MKPITIPNNAVLKAALCLLGAVLLQSHQAISKPAEQAEVKKTQGSAQPLQQPPPAAAPRQASPPQSAGIKFFEGTWANAVSKAKQEKKAIFVDAYASWCGPCKYMKRAIFTNADVGKFYNQNFVNLEVDWEKGEALPLHGKYPLRAFPTLMFFNPATEQVIAVAEGALDANNMIEFGNYGLDKMKSASKKDASASPQSATKATLKKQ